MGTQRVGHDEHAHTHTALIYRVSIPLFCPFFTNSNNTSTEKKKILSMCSI